MPDLMTHNKFDFSSDIIANIGNFLHELNFDNTMQEEVLPLEKIHKLRLNGL